MLLIDRGTRVDWMDYTMYFWPTYAGVCLVYARGLFSGWRGQRRAVSSGSDENLGRVDVCATRHVRAERDHRVVLALGW